MSSLLEQIVRPSQTPSIRPVVAAQLYATPKLPASGVVTWGSSGDSIFDLHAHSEDSVNNKWPEEKRTYDVVRVFNPDDHEQFIDTEVLTEYQGRNKISRDRIVMQFAQSTNTADTEVISRNNVRKQPGTD